MHEEEGSVARQVLITHGVEVDRFIAAGECQNEDLRRCRQSTEAARWLCGGHRRAYLRSGTLCCGGEAASRCQFRHGWRMFAGRGLVFPLENVHLLGRKSSMSWLIIWRLAIA